MKVLVINVFVLFYNVCCLLIYLSRYVQSIIIMVVITMSIINHYCLLAVFAIMIPDSMLHEIIDSEMFLYCFSFRFCGWWGGAASPLQFFYANQRKKVKALAVLYPSIQKIFTLSLRMHDTNCYREKKIYEREFRKECGLVGGPVSFFLVFPHTVAKKS
jgi:hypothetical protein